jgi:hypothetical protein
MISTDRRERSYFQAEEVTIVSEPEGSYVVFPTGSVISSAATDQKPGVTFDGLLQGEVEKHNNSQPFGVDPVGIRGVLGEDGGNGRREAWSYYRSIRWDPRRQGVMYINGSPETVKRIIVGAKTAARELQIARSGRPPASPRG